MILLLINEYSNYRQLIITTLTYVDKNRGSDQVPVNIELDLYNLPCELLSIEIRNDLGLVVQNIEGNLTKYNLNQNLEITGQKKYELENLGRFGHNHDHIAQPDYELVKQQINVFAAECMTLEMILKNVTQKNIIFMKCQPLKKVCHQYL